MVRNLSTSGLFEMPPGCTPTFSQGCGQSCPQGKNDIRRFFSWELLRVWGESLLAEDENAD